MVQTATKPLAKAGTANDRLQVREVVNTAQREKILQFRDRHGSILARFAKGAVVGEMAYLAATPRSADIVITRDAEVLVLTKDMFRNTIKQEPSVASKMLLNLILSERLLATSAQLTAHTQGF